MSLTTSLQQSMFCLPCDSFAGCNIEHLVPLHYKVFLCRACSPSFLFDSFRSSMQVISLLYDIVDSSRSTDVIFVPSGVLSTVSGIDDIVCSADVVWESEADFNTLDCYRC